MENKTVKMGVIGLGRGRSVLTDALKEGVTLVAICDRDEEKLQSAKEHFEKSVKKTLTIPSWLNDLALEKNINFSQVLQEALLAKVRA